MSEKFEREVLQRLATIEAKIEMGSFDPDRCIRHDEKLKVSNKRIAVLEGQQSKQNMVTMTMGAIGAALALLLKFIFMKGH